LSGSELRGIGLVALGLVTLGFYYSWWFFDGRLGSPWLVSGFAVAVFYGGIQLLLSWVVYLGTHYRQPATSPPSAGLTVDVFVTACGEDHALVERVLAAACAMRGQHRCWLLDDGQDAALAHLAERLGAGYLTRSERKQAKAGNINAALGCTQGDIVVIFDIDHAPKPDFLERSLGYFADARIGFVQVMLTFENGDHSWIAQAAEQSSQDFYNPISIGADGLNSATLIGSNALIRRAALESIGGYRPGLAEDLETSIALHAAGWRSAYVPEPLAPGLAPPDLAAWFTQQFKWARGVFETLLTAYPRYFTRLQRGQRLFYPVRMTYYWLGPVTCMHLLVTVFILLWGNDSALIAFQEYLVHLLPLSAVTLVIRLLALRRWRHPSLQHNFQWKPMALVFATWPVYTAAWLMALLRLPLEFRGTPKRPTGALNPWWLVPQFGSILLLSIALLYHIFAYEGQFYPLVLGFAATLVMPQLLFFFQCLPKTTLTTRLKKLIFATR
jgi:cellulose synthase (UDP-forming)